MYRKQHDNWRGTVFTHTNNFMNFSPGVVRVTRVGFVPNRFNACPGTDSASVFFTGELTGVAYTKALSRGCF